MNRKEKAVIVAIAANVLLIVLKFLLASLSGSVSLRASAWHSFSDLIPSIVVLMGLFLARREDTKATQGISRIENIAAVIVAGFIFYVGVEIVRDVLSRATEGLSNVPLVAAISLITIAITYFMARYQIYVGKETDSPALLANGIHARVDMYSSVVVVAALMGYIVGFATLDKIAAAIVVLLIFSNGLEILINAVTALRRGGFLDFSHHIGEVYLEKILQRIRRFAIAGAILLVIAYIASGLFRVNWNEAVIVERFGKPVRQVQAGLHYRLPWPLERMNRVALTDVRMAQVPSSLMLTGDENLIEIEAVAQYQVKDAFPFAYNLSDPGELVRSAVEASLRNQINQDPMEFILAEGKGEIQERAQRIAQDLLDQQSSGIRLLTVQLIKDAPPSDVMEAFRDVASAREDKDTYINEALAYQSEIVTKTQGEAQKLIEEAQGYRGGKIHTATGDAERFASKAVEYQKNRAVTEKRLYVEVLEKILPNVNKLILGENIKADNIELWFLKDGLSSKDIGEVKKP
jgi:membrane protease subunit HflK